MIDRAFPQQARAALDVFPHHARQGSRRAGATSSVAPKIATVGTFKAEAMCMLPESFVRYTSHAAASSMNSLSVVSPAKL